MAIEALKQGNQAAFFTFEYTAAQFEQQFAAFGADLSALGGRFMLDTSEDISSRHIAQRLRTAPPRTLVVVDYLQLLDQRRDKPALDVQVRELQAFARARQVLILCLAQISRAFEPAPGACPGPQDVRLPNPVDLALFSKTCFLNQGALQLHVGR